MIGPVFDVRRHKKLLIYKHVFSKRRVIRKLVVCLIHIDYFNEKIVSIIFTTLIVHPVNFRVLHIAIEISLLMRVMSVRFVVVIACIRCFP